MYGGIMRVPASQASPVSPCSGQGLGLTGRLSPRTPNRGDTYHDPQIFNDARDMGINSNKLVSEPIAIPAKKSKGKRSSKSSLISTVKSFQRCDSHPLVDESDEEDDDDVFDESFDRSSMSSMSSSSSFVQLKSNPLASITNTTVEAVNKSSANVLSFPKISIKKTTASSSLSKFQFAANDVADKAKTLPRALSEDLSKREVREVPIKSIEMTSFNELKSFNELDGPILDSYPTKTFKHRDERINNMFLKLYAIDLSCRKMGYLPNNSTDIEPSQSEMHQKYNLFNLSTTSRDKLWQSIILPPRTDDTPQNSIAHTNYVHVKHEKESSVIMKNGDYLPWKSGVKSWKPCGKLPHGKKLMNGENPNSGSTPTQYTVKGWCNSKWV